MAADIQPESAGEGANDDASDREVPHDQTAADPASGDAPSSDATSTALSEMPPAGLDASLAAASRGADDVKATGPRSFGARLLDYSAHAAMIVGLIGFAWTVSNHVVTHPAPAREGAAGKLEGAKAEPAAGELADLRQTNQRLAEDVRSLRANFDALSAKVHDDKTPTQLKALQAGLQNVQGGLAAARSETGSAVAQLSGKLDKIVHERAEHDAAARPQPDEHAGKPEKNSADLTTGSIPPAKATAAKPPSLVAEQVPLPPSKPGKAADADAPAKPTVIAGYVVRDVSGGVAVIEGRGGVLEVVPGVSVPGAGVVKSIERRGRGWTVITSKGQLAYAPLASEPRRTSQRDYYPAYRYDF